LYVWTGEPRYPDSLHLIASQRQGSPPIAPAGILVSMRTIVGGSEGPRRSMAPPCPVAQAHGVLSAEHACLVQP
jgi:hypothetical protein